MALAAHRRRALLTAALGFLQLAEQTSALRALHGRAVMPEEHHDAITGHANGSVGRSYGNGFPLKVLAESLGKVACPGLGLLNGGAAR